MSWLARLKKIAQLFLHCPPPQYFSLEPPLCWLHGTLRSYRIIIDQPRSSLVYRSISVAYVWICNTTTLERSFWSSRTSDWIRVSFAYEGHRASLTGEKGRKSLFLQCKTSIGNNSGTVANRAVKIACKIRFFFRCGGSNGETAIFVTWPEVTTSNKLHAFAAVRP